MIIVNSMNELVGAWINDQVQVLTAPTFDEPTKKWRALANAYGALAIIELKTSVLPHNEQMRAS